MVNYTLTILGDHLAKLREMVFSVPGAEGAAFLLCGESRTQSEHRLLCREVLPVPESAYLVREPYFLSLDSAAYAAAAKRAKNEKLAVVFVHSHPGGFLDYSEQDDREEPKLQEFLRARVPGRVHGSLVLTETGITGRVWEEGGFRPMSRVRVVGRRFEFHDRVPEGENHFLPFFDRQVRAFGPAAQGILGRLDVGVVALAVWAPR
jgi:proteasome lid subunit RPN8/RPN11